MNKAYLPTYPPMMLQTTTPKVEKAPETQKVSETPTPKKNAFYYGGHR